MIHIFFGPGMFGSTIEYVLRNYTNELTPVSGKILNDGSLHSFEKQAHICDVSEMHMVFQTRKNLHNKFFITTPIYPTRNKHLPEILTLFEPVISTNDRCILLYSNDVESAEFNIMFQYYKIAIGCKKTLDLFCEHNSHNFINWNKNYRHWKDLQDWELREWFSLFYVEWVQEWIDSYTQVPDNWLKIDHMNFLFQPESTMEKIMQFCQVTKKPGVADFFNEWKQKQQYVIDEIQLINNIVKSTVEQVAVKWHPINIIAESMVQQKLRSKGYEIRCDGLNTFPTDTKTLYNLLEKC